MSEIIGYRNLNSKHIDNDDGTFTMEVHCGHIHYQDGQNFEQIDTTLKPIADGWQQTKASYNQVLPLYADGDIIFNDQFNANREIIFTPVANHIQGILLDESDGWIQKRVRYKDAFGPGIHLECTSGNISFRKEVVIDADPKTDIEVRFKLEMPAEKLLIDGKEDIISHQKDLTSKIIAIGDSDIADELTYLRKATAWDSKGNVIYIPIQFEMSGQDVFLVKTIPAAFLRDAVYPVRSDITTSYYAGSGDGLVAQFDASWDWDAVHDDVSGTAFGSEQGGNSGCTAVNASTMFVIYRAFLPIDTSGLPNDAEIQSAILKIYALSSYYLDNDVQAYLGIVQTSQASPTALADVDYDQCGAVHSPTLGANTIRLENLTINDYNDFILDATGRSWIKKKAGDPYTMLGIREGHDIEDLAILQGEYDNYSGISFSERTGTSQDPYLSITYSIPKYLILVK